MMGGVDRFVNRKDMKTSNNSFENNKVTSDPTLVERQRLANNLRVPVPVARLETKPDINVSSLPGLAVALAARHPLHSITDSGPVSNFSHAHNVTNLAQLRSKFDDTEYEESTMSSIGGVPPEQMYVTNTIYNHFSPTLPRPSYAPPFSAQYSEEVDGHEGRVNPKIEGDEDHYRNDLNMLGPSNALDNPAFFKEIEEARRNGPANTRYLKAEISSQPNFIHHPVAARSPSPNAFATRPKSRPRSAQNPTMAPPTTKAIRKAPSVVPPLNTSTRPLTTIFDKTSSYTDSSAGRTSPPPAPNNTRDQDKKTQKRGLSEEPLLDYDPVALQTMSFEDLENQPFDHNPRRQNQENNQQSPPNHPLHPPSSSSSLDPNQQLLQTLKSLSSSPSSSRPNDQQLTSYFSSQSQGQWLTSTESLERRLIELFADLKQAREERRTVSRKFEDEIRQRMQQVRGSGDGIEKALAEIRGRAGGLLSGARTGRSGSAE